MTKVIEELSEALDAGMPEAQIRGFLGLPAERPLPSCLGPCGCPEREQREAKARRPEDLAPPSKVTLHLHSTRPPDAEIELSGNWLGNVTEIGEDELGLYLDVKLRRSRFRPSRYRISAGS